MLGVLGAAVVLRASTGPWFGALLFALVWFFGWMIAAVVLTWDEVGKEPDAPPGTPSARPPVGVRRTILSYGHAPAPEPSGWWVWLGPLSLLSLWARVLGVIAIPYYGQHWQHHYQAFFAWAFFTLWIPVLGMVIEIGRLGGDKRLFDSLDGTVGCLFVLSELLAGLTLIALIVAVAVQSR